MPFIAGMVIAHTCSIQRIKLTKITCSYEKDFDYDWYDLAYLTAIVNPEKQECA